jgi:hypothetical protein
LARSTICIKGNIGENGELVEKALSQQQGNDEDEDSIASGDAADDDEDDVMVIVQPEPHPLTVGSTVVQENLELTIRDTGQERSVRELIGKLTRFAGPVTLAPLRQRKRSLSQKSQQIMVLREPDIDGNYRIDFLPSLEITMLRCPPIGLSETEQVEDQAVEESSESKAAHSNRLASFEEFAACARGHDTTVEALAVSASDEGGLHPKRAIHSYDGPILTANLVPIRSSSPSITRIRSPPPDTS